MNNNENIKQEVDAVLDLFGYTPEEKERFGLINDWLVERMQEKNGCRCPLCKQQVKLYFRSISYSMARALILIYRYYQSHDKKKSIHIEGYLKRCRISSSTRGDVAKLRHWGLLKKREGKRKDGSNRNGHYWITDDGERFVRRETTVRKYAKLYNNKFYGLAGGHVDIVDTLREKFNYIELMNQTIETVY